MISKETIEYRRANHLCIRCGKAKAIEGKTRCKECTDRDNARRKKNREYCSDNGICTRCGINKAEPHKKICYECLGKERDYYHARGRSEEQQKRNTESKRRAVQHLKDMGLCIRCGKRTPADGRFECPTCLAKKKRFRDRRRKNYAKYEWVGVGLCAICGDSNLVEGKKLCQKCYDRQLVNISKAFAHRDNSYWKSLETARIKGVKSKARVQNS